MIYKKNMKRKYDDKSYEDKQQVTNIQNNGKVLFSPDLSLLSLQFFFILLPSDFTAKRCIYIMMF